MNCAVERHNCGNVKMKTLNCVQNSYHKEQDFDKIVNQLCTRIQDIKDNDRSDCGGMRTRGYEETEAVRKYCAAFPALNKGEGLPCYWPPPEWCRKNQENMMDADLALSKDFSLKTKRSNNRRNSNRRKGNKKRSHNKSFESQENLPEWMTDEGEWDIETQEPVMEFIRTLALDEGYGTCENTVTDELRASMQPARGPDELRSSMQPARGPDELRFSMQPARGPDELRSSMQPARGPDELRSSMQPARGPDELRLSMQPARVPDLDDALELMADFTMEELAPRAPPDDEAYAKFQAKFNRSLEALWEPRDTPDDECQELPIDFHDLLSSPSDNQFADPSAEKCEFPSQLVILAADADEDPLLARLRPLRLDEPEPFSLYSYEGIYESLPSVAHVMQSLAALNHSKQSAFCEVVPAPCGRLPRPAPLPVPEPVPAPADTRDEALTAEQTTFRPIRCEAETQPAARYEDGHTFDISGELDAVLWARSPGGALTAELAGEQRTFLRVRTRSIDYSRLELPAALRQEFEEPAGLRLKLPWAARGVAVQTEPDARAAWGQCAECGGRGAKQRRAEPPAEQLAREWDELMADIQQYATDGDRKRRRAPAACPRPHAPFLPCLPCLGALRPLTR